MTDIRQKSPAQAIAEALVEKGILTTDRLEEALALISPLIPKSGAHAFTADSDFLTSSIEHHVRVYFKTVMEPAAMSHHAAKQTGRQMTDKEITDASVELTVLVMKELGKPYQQHMERYFGGDEGCAAFVYSRVHAKLLIAAQDHNDGYLTRIAQAQSSKRTAAAVAEKT